VTGIVLPSLDALSINHRPEITLSCSVLPLTQFTFLSITPFPIHCKTSCN